VEAPSEQDVTGEQLEICNVTNKKRVDKSEALENFKIAMYAIVLGRCTKGMEGQLKTRAKFEMIKAQQHGIHSQLL
jgi:hypothetical protein